MTQTTAADRALAGWESATVQNLGPLLNGADSDALWLAILAHRESGDGATFATQARALSADPRTHRIIELAIASLPASPSAPTAEPTQE